MTDELVKLRKIVAKTFRKAKRWYAGYLLCQFAVLAFHTATVIDHIRALNDNDLEELRCALEPDRPAHQARRKWWSPGRASTRSSQAPDSVDVSGPVPPLPPVSPLPLTPPVADAAVVASRSAVPNPKAMKRMR